MFSELYNTTKSPGYTIQIYKYLDRLDALWDARDKWLEFLWM